MSDTTISTLEQLERTRIKALIAVDVDRFDALHDDEYQLCNPTGALWSKREYRDRLATGRLVYRQLDLTSAVDVVVSDRLAVLRYRCRIALRVEGTEIPAHECQHVDVYRRAEDDRWRCRYSQATAIMDTVAAPSR